MAVDVDVVVEAVGVAVNVTVVVDVTVVELPGRGNVVDVDRDVDRDVSKVWIAMWMWFKLFHVVDVDLIAMWFKTSKLFPWDVMPWI